MRKPEIINKLRNACKSCQNRRRKDKRKTQIKSAGTVNEVISAIACVGVFVALVYWCLPAKSSALMIERPQLSKEIKNKVFADVDSDSLSVEDETLCANIDTSFKESIRNYLSEGKKNKEDSSGKTVDILQVIDNFLQKSVSVYSSSLIQVEGQYKIYKVIYRIHFENVDRYALCNILKNKRKGSRDEIRLVKESSQLMDLDSLMVVRRKL